MGRYLLAAEADKIQDFVFRSSRLKEVVGGSQLLTRFCQKVPDILLANYGVTPDDIIVQDGGAFRIIFDSKEQAVAFGEELAELYRLVTDSSLTVAEPVEIENNFGAANFQADENLRLAKRWHDRWHEQEQMPYMAFCELCGIGIAETYGKDYEDESRYLCASCLHKKAEQAEKLGVFLKLFYKIVVDEKDLVNADWPGKGNNDPTQEIAAYDPRDYIAYLVADGNGMGKIFSKCANPSQMQALSRGLRDVMQGALVEPAKEILNKNPLEGREGFIPVLPLIMGGDDLFALIPAPWALDFAKSFCQTYERKMAELTSTEEVGLAEICPTISAAVVICKRKYPYKNAYQVGLTRLREAKEVGKERDCSTINYELLKGGSLSCGSFEGEVRPTLRPYLMRDAEIPGWGLSLRQLLEQRWELRTIANKRLSELQGLYDLDNLPRSMRRDEFFMWKAKLDQFLNRLRQRNETPAADLIEASLNALGQAQEDGWLYQVTRQRKNLWWGHALPDLLEVWDFTLKLDKECPEYEEGC